MTDLENVQALFQELGLPVTKENRVFAEGSPNEPDDDVDAISGSVLSLTADDNEKVIGYAYFTAQFYFDTNGKFIQVGIWE